MVTSTSEITDSLDSTIFNSSDDEIVNYAVANEINTKNTIHVSNARPYHYYIAQPVSLINLDRLEEGIQREIVIPRDILQDHTVCLPEYYDELYGSRINSNYVNNNNTNRQYVPEYNLQPEVVRGVCDECCCCYCNSNSSGCYCNSRECNKRCARIICLKAIMLVFTGIVIIGLLIIIAITFW